MFNYTGYECKSCGKKFTDDDDIVVCPECGTPYHRDCYKKEGRCINDELHSKHMSWKAEVEEKEQAEGLKCSVCGNTLRNDQLFCDKCGTPTPYYLSQKDKADGEEQESAPHSKQVLHVELSETPAQYDLLRRQEEDKEVNS